MRYTVVATRKARRQLARFWTAASSPDRGEITRASAVIDATLRNHPKAIAKARPEGLFIADEPPLRVYFEISEPDRLVKINHYALIA